MTEDRSIDPDGNASAAQEGTAEFEGMPSDEFWARQEQLDSDADNVAAILSSLESYATIGIDVTTATITVYGTERPADDEWNEVSSRISNGNRLRFSPVRLSRIQVAKLSDYVAGRDKTELDVVSAGQEMPSGKFVIALRRGELTEGDKKVLGQYGTDTYEVRHSEGGPTAGGSRAR